MSALLLLMLLVAPPSSDLKVTVTNAVDGKGKVVVSLFANENDFLRKPQRVLTAEPRGGSATVTFPGVSAGTYAVGAYQDLNGNQKLDRNWIGIPKEPNGMSNEAKGKYGPPKWRDAQFDLRPEITIRLE